MQSFILNSHEVFIHIHQGCFAGTGAIVMTYGKISQCITTPKHSKAVTVCIFLGYTVHLINLSVFVKYQMGVGNKLHIAILLIPHLVCIYARNRNHTVYHVSLMLLHFPVYIPSQNAASLTYNIILHGRDSDGSIYTHPSLSGQSRASKRYSTTGIVHI